MNRLPLCAKCGGSLARRSRVIFRGTILDRKREFGWHEECREEGLIDAITKTGSWLMAEVVAKRISDRGAGRMVPPIEDAPRSRVERMTLTVRGAGGSIRRAVRDLQRLRATGPHAGDERRNAAADDRSRTGGPSGLPDMRPYFRGATETGKVHGDRRGTRG